jgi:hypothetical protein
MLDDPRNQIGDVILCISATSAAASWTSWRSDEDMLRLWSVAVAETRDRLEGPWE